MPDLLDGSPVTDLPLYWFAKLERAVEEGDHQAAAKAQLELQRLGVRVAYGRPSEKRREVGRCPDG
jgi:hypothetical protein